MDSLVSVEKECDKAADLFESFYNDVDQNVNQVIEKVLAVINDLSKSISRLKSSFHSNITTLLNIRRRR